MTWAGGGPVREKVSCRKASDLISEDAEFLGKLFEQERQQLLVEGLVDV
jgi:hypothetical protein